MYRKLFLPLLAALAVTALHAQVPIGQPEVFNFSRQVYRGGAQSRQVAQDHRGLLYFANEEGLLSFDGTRWKLYPLPNKSLVRCLKFGPDKQLYVGGQDEFGYFAPAEGGRLQYRSLKERLPAGARSFSDVWEICFDGKTAFFQTSDRIYVVNDQQARVYPDPHWLFMARTGSGVVAQNGKGELLRYDGARWVPFLKEGGRALPAGAVVTSLTAIGQDSILLTTLKNGLYLLKENVVANWDVTGVPGLAAKNISSSALVNPDQVAIGTSVDGCYLFDKQGRLVQHFGRREGLQDNNILTIFTDRAQNLWFGLHNGIDLVAYNSAVRHINPASLNEGAGYTSALYQNELYVGTSIGLYKFATGGRRDLSRLEGNATPIQGTTGDVWNLSEVEGQLLMGHNEGAFAVLGNTAVPLDRSTGFWNFGLQSTTLSPLMVAGTYRGLSFYTRTGNGFARAAPDAVVESARFVIPAFDRVWISHPYKGIYAVRLKNGISTVKKYGPSEGVLSVNNNYLFRVRGALLLTTEEGVLEYRPETDVFTPSVFYNTVLPRVPIRYLKEDRQGNVWFVFEKKIAVLDLSGQKPQVIYLPELTNKLVAGFEHINPVDENNVLVGGEKGFYHINYSLYKRQQPPLQLLITTVSAISQGDSLLFGGYDAPLKGSRQRPPRLNHTFHSLHFEFAAPVYGQPSTIEYSYYLEGFDRGWSAYGQKTEKDYTNLPPGDYVFRVKARNSLGTDSAVSEFAFTVLPPWYRTRIAFLFYLVLAGLGLYHLVRYQQQRFRAQQRRHEEEQRRLQYLHQLEMEKAEKELVELRNQKLEAEIRSKNTELASTAMHLVQKRDVLQKIKVQMTKLKDVPAPVETTADLKKILRTLNEEDKMEEQWPQFAQHFDAVHRDFLAKLKAAYPTLTPNEQKLCAYLKMNLSTKEMAQLMNITVRGVEISRYRLRKKLGVPGGTHLSNFLDGVA